MCQPRAVIDSASNFAVACIEVYNVHVHVIAVLLCPVCLFDLACFFLLFLLISHLKTCNCYPNSVMYSVCVMGV